MCENYICLFSFKIKDKIYGLSTVSNCLQRWHMNSCQVRASKLSKPTTIIRATTLDIIDIWQLFIMHC